MAGYLSQGTLRLLLVGLVSVAAISMGAATITSTLDAGVADSSGDSLGDIDPNNTGDEQRPDSDTNWSTGGGDGSSSGLDLEVTRCYEPLNTTPGTLGYFAAAGLLVYLIKRRYSFGAALIGSYGLAPVVLVAYFLMTDCIEGGGGAMPNTNVGSSGGGGGSSIIAPPDVSPIWLVAVLGVVAVAAVAVMFRASGDQTVEIDDDEDPGADGPDVADLAAAAGEAADRLEEHDADVDNAVYRAWWEMTRLLELPDSDSATPGEFAEAAIDLGMSEDDVGQLTELFEEVRYGERDPASREDLAIEVFRSIESEYGTGGTTDLEAGSTDDTTDTTEDDDGH